jgi:ABC-type nitrate/sulfonate/bicarbonate transport system substrate-binding protein
LAVRADLDVKRGDLGALKGLRISSSTAFPEVGLRHLLRQSGIDLERDGVSIVPLPHTKDEHLKYRVGVDALDQNIADAYWGNGMRLAIGEKLGVAKVHLDLRRGDGPPGARFYNFAALTTTERLIDEQPQVVAGAVRAIVKAQQALKADPSRATSIGERLFAPEAASLIAGLIARDAPFYEPAISAEAVDGINTFAMANGLLAEPLAYARLVATQFRDLAG